jgi:hypothetical protein
MTDAPVAVHTQDCMRIRRVAGYEFIDTIEVADNTIFLQYAAVCSGNYDWFMKVLHGECPGVVVAVDDFGNVFTHKIMWQMTIDTGCCCVMTCLLPAVILSRHDVAVHAGLGLFTEIRKPFGIIQSEATKPEEYPEKNGEQNNTCTPPDAVHRYIHCGNIVFVV